MREDILRLLMESYISLNDLQIVIRLLDAFTGCFILMGEEKLLGRFFCPSSLWEDTLQQLNIETINWV